jgi:hypothetical protein
MLKLRKEHLAAFEAQAAASFSQRVVAHLKAVWPAECAELGDAPLAETARAAIQRAVALGLSAEFDVVRFVDLTFILAKDFDTNPLAMWTRPILADRKVPAGARVDRLYQRMEEEFGKMEKKQRPKV